MGALNPAPKLHKSLGGPCFSILSSLCISLLVRDLCESHDDQLRLFVSTIHNYIQAANDFKHKLDQLSFTRPLTSETLLTVSNYYIKCSITVDVKDDQVYAPVFCNDECDIIRNMILFNVFND